MSKLTVKQIKDISKRERYYPYDEWVDYIFSPLAPYLAWFFIRLGISGNGVSWTSGFVAILGGTLLASDISFWIVLGSFSILIFYQLDYVDGAVSRYNRKAGVDGQYIDLLMHIITHVSIIAGMGLSVLLHNNSNVYPLVILAIIASVLTCSKSAFAWFAIAMQRQKDQASNAYAPNQKSDFTIHKDPNILYELFRKFTVLIFFETYLMFTLPILAILHVTLLQDIVDFRFVLIVIAACIYFPVSVIEIVRITNRNAVSDGYSKLFQTDHIPNIPDDHFFRYRGDQSDNSTN